MDITNQLLEMIKDSLHYFRFIICLLIIVGFLKTALTMWLNYKIKKLEHKSTYQVVFDGSHRAINLTTSEKIEFEKLERHLINSPMLLAETKKQEDEKKSAA